MPDIRPLTLAGLQQDPALAGRLLGLNNLHAAELSWLDGAGLAALIGMAFHAEQVDHGAAMMIALDQGAAYGSPNFVWFCQRYPRFVYVDRIVVDGAARGQGLAQHLYARLFAAARAAGYPRVVCEVNVVPPNPGSMALHRALGFAECGQATLPGGKRVAYLERAL